MRAPTPRRLLLVPNESRYTPPPVRADGRLPAYLSDFPEPNLLRREPDQRPSTAETTHTLPSSAIKGNFRA